MSFAFLKEFAGALKLAFQFVVGQVLVLLFPILLQALKMFSQLRVFARRTAVLAELFEAIVEFFEFLFERLMFGCTGICGLCAFLASVHCRLGSRGRCRRGRFAGGCWS